MALVRGFCAPERYALLIKITFPIRRNCMNYKQRFKHALLPVLLPVISYGILGPLEIYFGNAS